ncbi:MAG: hypothetical protein ACREBQ_08455, partial [Nitrososphaerales archaeon]
EKQIILSQGWSVANTNKKEGISITQGRCKICATILFSVLGAEHLLDMAGANMCAKFLNRKSRFRSRSSKSQSSSGLSPERLDS